MLYFIVNKSDLVILGQYEADEPTTAISWWGNYYLVADQHTHLPLPEGLDPDCIKAQLNENQEIVLVADSGKIAAKARADKLSRIAARKQVMLDAVASGMLQTYGTTSETSALTFHLTYKDMVETPSDWVGDLYPNTDAVLAFATPRLNTSKAFGLQRLALIAQYESEKAAIENE